MYYFWTFCLMKSTKLAFSSKSGLTAFTHWTAEPWSFSIHLWFSFLPLTRRKHGFLTAYSPLFVFKYSNHKITNGSKGTAST